MGLNFEMPGFWEYITIGLENIQTTDRNKYSKPYLFYERQWRWEVINIFGRFLYGSFHCISQSYNHCLFLL